MIEIALVKSCISDKIILRTLLGSAKQKEKGGYPGEKYG